MGHRPDWNDTNFKKTSVRKFADGGDVDAREAAREGFAPEREPIVDSYEYGRYQEMEDNKARYERDQAASKESQIDRDAQEAARELSTIASAKSEPKKQSFSEAFAENRKAGNKTFEWNGKLYNTELAKPSKADVSLGKLHVSAKRDTPAAAPVKTADAKKIVDYGDDKERMAKRKPMTVFDRKMRSMSTGLPEELFMADGGKAKKK